MKGNEEEVFVNSLKDIISVELDIERVKQSLSLKADFNLYDLFKLFDKHQIGHIYKNEMEDGLNKLGVFPMRHELSLFFKKYDLNNNGKLRFGEFCKAFLPKDKIYADHLSNKHSNYARYPEDAFTSLTKLEIADAFRKHLRSENEVEEIRKRLQRRPLFNISEAF